MREKDLKEDLATLAYKAEADHEVQMARADLYKIAKYSIKLHEMMKGVTEEQGLEGWVQSKITKAADYMGSVYHHLDYEMKFDEMTEAKKAKPDFADIDGDGDEEESMKKAAQDKKEKGGDDKKDDSKGLSAKQKKLPAGLQKAIAKKNEDVVKEGAEESATLVMAAKDMVDRVTGWMEDTAEMQTESMLELGDKIRDEMGSEQSEQFINTVKPALENLYTVFETTREALSGGVAIVTGEGAPETMGTDAEAPAEDPEAEMEPTVDADAGAEEPVADEFGASEPATGGEEVADREKRESIERSRRLGQVLTDSKKKAPVK